MKDKLVISNRTITRRLQQTSVAVEKVAELNPNAALWYSAESQVEKAMKNFDVVAGM